MSPAPRRPLSFDDAVAQIRTRRNGAWQNLQNGTGSGRTLRALVERVATYDAALELLDRVVLPAATEQPTEHA